MKKKLMSVEDFINFIDDNNGAVEALLFHDYDLDDYDINNGTKVELKKRIENLRRNFYPITEILDKLESSFLKD